MYSAFSGYFADYVRNVLGKYRNYLPLYLTCPIGFDGATASQRVTVFTPAVDADALLFGANVDFSNPLVNLKITDTASGYVWSIIQTISGSTLSGTPITAIAGVTTQALPILPLVVPFFLSRQSKLQLDFQNSATSLTTNGNITWVALKLLDKN